MRHEDAAVPPQSGLRCLGGGFLPDRCARRRRATFTEEDVHCREAHVVAKVVPGVYVLAPGPRRGER